MPEKKEMIEKKRYQPPALMLLGEVDWGTGASCSVGLIAVVECVPGNTDAGHTYCAPGGSANWGSCAAGPARATPYDVIVP